MLRTFGWVIAVALACTFGCGGDTGSASLDAGSDAVTDAVGDVLADGSDDTAQDVSDDGDDRDAVASDVDATQDAGSDAGAGIVATWTTEPGLRVEVHGAPPRIELSRDDTVLLTFGDDALRIAWTPTYDDGLTYDPTGLFDDSNPFARAPDVSRWARWTRVTPVDGARMQVDFDDGTALVMTVDAGGDGRFRFILQPPEGSEAPPEGSGDTPPDTAPGVPILWRLTPTISTSEGLYGLGEWFDQVDNRGRVRPMQIIPDALESGYNENHVPVPFVTGTTGWGLFVASDRVGAWDCGATDPSRLDVAFAVGPAPHDALEFWLFGAPHPLDVTLRYYETTGMPARPAPWALGPWLWRDENRDAAEVVSDAQILRDLDLPHTAIWIDRPYASAVNSFDFDPDRFPDPDAMIDELHALGLRVALWHTPYVDEDAAATADLVAEARDGGFFPPVTGLNLNGWGTPLDLTNPDAFAWWQTQIRRYTDRGIEGFKLDYGEDIIPGILGGRQPWVFADGSDERTMHAGYQRFYHRAYAELLPETGGFILARGGTWGDQANVSVIWPGDLDADFADHREEVERDGETMFAVGGVHAAMIGGLTLGPSGFPLYGSDTGGYRHCPPDAETFLRWASITALSPVMQVGTSCNDVAWEPRWGDERDNARVLERYRELTRLHLRLWPYVWTYVDRQPIDGRPIQRALGLAYPELGEHPSDAFLLGDALYSAPIVERGESARDVLIPPGPWRDVDTGEYWDGGVVTKDSTDPGEVILYALAGFPVPMLRPTIEAIAPTTRPDEVDSFATDPGPLTVWIAAPRDGDAAQTFTVFDGTRFDTSIDGERFTVTGTPGDVFDQHTVLDVYGTSPADAVYVDGVAAPRVESIAADTALPAWTFESLPYSAPTTRVVVPAGAFTVVVEGVN